MRSAVIRRLAFTALFFSLASGLAACGGLVKSCTMVAASGLNVTVVDDATGQPICDATVTAADGSFTETLEETGCSFGGARERPGTYTVSAAKAGYTTASQSGVVVTADECHVRPVTVTLRLAR